VLSSAHGLNGFAVYRDPGGIQASAARFQESCGELMHINEVSMLQCVFASRVIVSGSVSSALLPCWGPFFMEGEQKMEAVKWSHDQGKFQLWATWIARRANSIPALGIWLAVPPSKENPPRFPKGEECNGIRLHVMMVDVWVLHQCGNHKRIALKCLVKRFLHKYRAELVTFNEEMQFKKNFFYLVSYWLMGISWGKDMRPFFF